MLTMEISNLEVHATIRALPTHKVVSHDGIPIEIFGMLWREIGIDVTKFLLKTFEQGVMDQHLNIRLQSLIPKPSPRTCINNYRPISILTSTYKIVAKVLAFCFQPLFLDYIRATQIRFVKEIHILNNVFVATKAMQ
jgi:hypothetical protein